MQACGVCKSNKATIAGAIPRCGPCDMLSPGTLTAVHAATSEGRRRVLLRQYSRLDLVNLTPIQKRYMLSARYPGLFPKERAFASQWETTNPALWQLFREEEARWNDATPDQRAQAVVA